MRKLIRFLLLLSALLLVKVLCHRATDGFALWKIRSEHIFDPRWEVSFPKEETTVQSALQQKFHYWCKGGQCYVFLSEDGQFVLKFFKFSHLKGKRWKKDFKSYKLAYEELRRESALLLLHLNPTVNRYGKLTLVDRLHIEHVLSLDDTLFLLQRRAELIFPSLSASMEKGDVEGAKNKISSLVQLLFCRAERGIEDNDSNVRKNFGFIDGRAVMIDVGRLKKREGAKPSIKGEDWADWLKERFPELWHHFLKEYEKVSNLDTARSISPSPL